MKIKIFFTNMGVIIEKNVLTIIFLNDLLIFLLNLKTLSNTFS